MQSLIFDVETNGFLAQLTCIHCLWIADADTGQLDDYADQPGISPIEAGLWRLMGADVIIGHNIIKFDLRAIQKVYPWFKLKPGVRIIDTMVLAQLFWPELKKTDKEKRKANPKYLQGMSIGKGTYTLKAFGLRLGIAKGDYTGTWEIWNPEMHRYCGQDVRVNLALWRKCLIRWFGGENKPEDFIPYSDDCVDLEMDFQAIIARQEDYGVAFDETEAGKLYSFLVGKRNEIERELKRVFRPWYVKDEEITPKVNNAKLGRTKGHPLTKIELIEFNPKSTHHITNRLQKLRGWKPVEFTDSGQPKIDDAVMSKLPYPEAPLLTEFLLLNKRISALAEGKKAWLKKVVNGRIHGGVVTLGAVTRRCTHIDPNLAQVPSVKKLYGKECRSLFKASKGMLLVGCDADSLELRCLGGYMAQYDDGEYVQVILSGDKALGTDMHSVNARALGLDPAKKYNVDGKMLSGRDIAKTWFYAFIYGSGSENLGWILGKRGDPDNPDHWKRNKRTGERVDQVATKAGTKSKNDFLKNLPALGKLAERVLKRATSRGFVLSIDGSKLFVRKSHAALNTLLQSAGAIFMKRALVILDRRLQEAGLIPGADYEFVLNIHDEWQIDVANRDFLPEWVGFMAEDAIRDAGVYYNFRCPLAGNADIGENWAATH